MTIMSCEFESHFLHEEKIFAEIAQLVEAVSTYLWSYSLTWISKGILDISGERSWPLAMVSPIG